jgi:hypothetical protein
VPGGIADLTAPLQAAAGRKPAAGRGAARRTQGAGGSGPAAGRRRRAGHRPPGQDTEAFADCVLKKS